MSAGRTDFCEECGPSRARGQDFCAGCSTYLAWDAALAPPTSTAAARTPAAAPPDEGFAVAIEAGDVVVADDGPLTRVRVAPGRRITFTVRIRNVGVDVHRYRVDVEGVPTEWVTIDPASLDLLPAGPVGRDGGEVLVTVAPPRASSAGAGVRAIAFNVRSTERDGEVRHLPLELDVEAYTDLTFTVAPARTRGRRRARAVATIQNRGNQTLLPAVTAAFDDPDLRCEVRPIDPIPAGHTGRARLAIRTPPRLLGRPEEHLLEVAVTASDDAPPVPPAVIRHARRALIPWWVPLVLLTLAAIAIALYAALRPEAKVEMPQLRGTPSAFAAQQVLQKQGFLGAPEVKTRVVIGLASGTVVDQAPEAGSKVRPDATVTLRVAVAPSSAAVPDLVGKRLRDADALLTAAHLKLGPVVPSTDPSRRIVSQTPLAGSVRPNGTLVSLVVAGPERVKIPNVRCFTVTNAERRLTQAGLKVLNLATITQPGRRVRTQVPAAGAMRAPGTAVNIVVDRAPKCSTSDQKTADQTAARVGATAQAASGASVVVPPAAPEIPFEGLAWGDADHVVSAESGLALADGLRPTWSGNGRRLVTVTADGRLLQTIGGRTREIRAAPSTGRVVAASFAVDRPAVLLAFVTVRPGGGAVCLTRADGDVPACRELPGLTPRGVAWGTGATSLFVVAAPIATPRPSGCHRTDHPPARFDGDDRLRGRWPAPSGAGVNGHEGSIYAISQWPKRNSRAVVTDLDADGSIGRPQVVYVGPGRIATLAQARWAGLFGCELAFAPWGSELAVVDTGRSCSATPRPGTLMVVPVEGGGSPTGLSARASSPAWGPGAAR